MTLKIKSIFVFILLLCFSPFLFAEDQGVSWPKTFSSDDNSLVIYQPQIDTWEGKMTLTGKVAVELTLAGSRDALVGVLWFEGQTSVDKANRLVTIHNVNITRSTFFEQDAEKEKLAEEAAQKLFPQTLSMSLDNLLGQIANSSPQSEGVPVNNDPPAIFVSTSAAKLVLFDGEPLWHAIADTDLSYAVNSNWNIFFDSSTKTYFLLNEGDWLTSSDLMAKDWKKAHVLPEGFNKLPNDDNWKEVKAALPLKKNSDKGVPTLWVSTKPAELILLKGAPNLRQIPNTNIMAVTNTESDLFFYEEDENYYYLVSGRWFKSTSLNGPWTYAGAALPKDFASIPESDPQSRVLASVPGTAHAQTAIQTADIPELATVSKHALSLTVTYVGDPQFKTIPGTSLSYAVNTQIMVIKVKENYYALSNGVWFFASSPKGPWVVAEFIPNEVYKIPPSSPLYPATYVKIYGVNLAKEEVIFGYTSGYMGMYIAGGVLVFGTGYYYPPYYTLIRPLYPIYFPYFQTYGLAAYYSPYYGVFYRHGYAYGPYYGINGVAIYNPATHGYYRGVAAYGPYQAGRGFVAYNPVTGVHAAGYQRVTPYASWGRGVISQGDKWARGGYYSGPVVTAGHITTSTGTSATAVKGKGGDLYVGKDGNVYKNVNGKWYNWNNGSWNQLLGGKEGEHNLNSSNEAKDSHLPSRQNTEGTASSDHHKNLEDLNHEYNTRTKGNIHMQNYQSWRSSGQNPRAFGASSDSHRMGGGGHRR